MAGQAGRDDVLDDERARSRAMGRKPRGLEQADPAQAENLLEPTRLTELANFGGLEEIDAKLNF